MALTDAPPEAFVAAAGVADEAPFVRAVSYSNEVWLGRTVALRVSRGLKPWTFEHERSVLPLLPSTVPHPAVLRSGSVEGRPFQVTRRLPGTLVASVWPALSKQQRRHLITQLAQALDALHALEIPPGWQRPDLTLPAIAQQRTPQDVARPFQQPPWRIAVLADAALELPFIDRALVQACRAFVSDRLPFFANDAQVLTHADLHWENLLADGDTLTGVLDWEHALAAAPDLELDVLLRFCRWPHLPVSAEYESYLRPEDFAAVPAWLAELSSRLFASPHQRERLEAYAVMHDLRQLILFPQPPEHQQAPWSSVVRLRATLDGTSYLRQVV